MIRFEKRRLQGHCDCKAIRTERCAVVFGIIPRWTCPRLCKARERRNGASKLSKFGRASERTARLLERTCDYEIKTSYGRGLLRSFSRPCTGLQGWHWQSQQDLQTCAGWRGAGATSLATNKRYTCIPLRRRTGLEMKLL